MKKLFFIFCLIFSIGGLFVFLYLSKADQFETMEEMGAKMRPPPETVSTSKVQTQIWQERISSVGSIEPINGVLLEAELPGVVQEIAFQNGDKVAKGQLLVQLDIAVEQAQLKAAEASARLAKVELERATRLRESGNVPQSDLDRAQAEFDRTGAEVENLKAMIARKTITAPFAGKAGIRQVNLGQYVPIGAPIIALQSYDQVYVNFTLPQQFLPRVRVGDQISLQSDAFADRTFEGMITAISPEVDPLTRTIEAQGTIDNPEELLRSGLFVKVSVDLPAQQEVLVVPSTAIKYAPYGNSVFKVKTTDEGMLAQQVFVRTGKRKGDFVSITSGLEDGDEFILATGDDVVSAGAFKIGNGAAVSVNNELSPTVEAAPTPPNS
ncbi:MAG: efflux RND transporter periplasmic adaptor subunit [Verrucomicrobiota bacterium]